MAAIPAAPMVAASHHHWADGLTAAPPNADAQVLEQTRNAANIDFDQHVHGCAFWRKVR